MNFCNRTVFKDGRGELIQSPLITYKVELDSEAKHKLSNALFRDACSLTRCVIQTRRGKIKVGEHGYVFNVDISARPDMQDSILLSRASNTVEICLKLEDTRISLFDKAENAYLEYTSRFEMLDIR